MKLIIDVDDSFYRSCKRYPKLHDGKFEFIANGTPLEEELEEIKQEITNIQIETCTIPKTAKDIQYEALWILKNHISEMKGENNE